jgi:hypothetical protein
MFPRRPSRPFLQRAPEEQLAPKPGRFLLFSSRPPRVHSAKEICVKGIRSPMRLELASIKTIGAAVGLMLATALLAAAQNPAELQGKTAEQAFKKRPSTQGHSCRPIGPDDALYERRTRRRQGSVLGPKLCLDAEDHHSRAEGSGQRTGRQRKIQQACAQSGSRSGSVETAETPHRYTIDAAGPPKYPGLAAFSFSPITLRSRYRSLEIASPCSRCTSGSASAGGPTRR